MGEKKSCKKNENISKDEAKYICKKCERFSKKEKHLCKPKQIEK
jgi:hypothetical protein